MTVLIVMLAVVAALVLALVVALVYVVRKAGDGAEKRLHSITRFLFTTMQISAITWVSISYLLAAYQTIVLQIPFPAEELSGKAIDSILVGLGIKMIGNIFEHNDSKILGTSNKTGSDEGRTI